MACEKAAERSGFCAEELIWKIADLKALMLFFPIDTDINHVGNAQNRGLWSAIGYQLRYDYNQTVR